jgi:hypothetical protein
MKKLLIVLLLPAAISCGEANDGDATTDTTDFTNTPVSTAPYGDTAKGESSTGTQTTIDMRTSKDVYDTAGNMKSDTGRDQ